MGGAGNVDKGNVDTDFIVKIGPEIYLTNCCNWRGIHLVSVPGKKYSVD